MRRFKRGFRSIVMIIGLCISSTGRSSTREEFVEVPFDFSKNEIIVQVKINDKGPFAMMLDTGTDPSAIDLSTAREIGLKLDSIGRKGSGGGTGTNLAYATKLGRIELGGLAANNVEAVAIDLEHLQRSLRRGLVDLTRTPHLRIVAHPAQQAVRDARCTSTTRCDLDCRWFVDRDAENLSRSLEDDLQVLWV